MIYSLIINIYSYLTKMTTYINSNIETLLDFLNPIPDCTLCDNPFDNPNYMPSYIGEKHSCTFGTSSEYYDINISKSPFIKLYHGNRNIDKTRVNTIYQKFKTKPVDFPSLIVAHIIDTKFDKNEYVLVDGQHRYSTMKELFFIDKRDIIFTYKLYRCKSVEELEELFNDINCNVKFDDIIPYKKIGKLMDKIEVHFKSTIVNTKNPRSHHFNPLHLKEKLSAEKLFEIYDISVDDAFKKIIELNQNIRIEYIKKKSEKKLPKYDIHLLERIDANKKNPMYLLMKEEFKWIDDLKLML